LLAAPLTRLANDTIYRICLNFLQSDAFAQVLDTAARALHRGVMAVVRNDEPLLNEMGGQVVLNLRPVVERVVEELAGERGLEALSNLDIPEDAGIIVVSEEADHPWLWDLVRWIDDFNPVIPIIAIVILALGILVAPNRRRAIIAAGAGLAIVAGLMLLALAVPVKELSTTWPPTPEGEQAVSNIYDILLDSFRRQQFAVVFVGLGMVLVGTAAGDRRLVRAAQSAARRRKDVDASGLVQERAGALRLAGLVVAAVILILWPEPGLRTVITIGVLLAIYLAIIWVLASNSELAQRARTWLADTLTGAADGPIQRGGLVGWVARHVGILRLIGIVIAACLVAFVWNLSLSGFILIAGAVLLYLAIIEAASVMAREPLESPDD
jgi:hypothetical protein